MQKNGEAYMAAQEAKKAQNGRHNTQAFKEEQPQGRQGQGAGKANPKDIRPPGWNENWEWRYPEANRPSANPRWFDPDGGEWRWHAPDRWHPEGHWDHNQWHDWNSQWQNIYPE